MKAINVANNSVRNTVKTMLTAAILGFSTLASAAQYKIQVTGNFVKDPSFSSSFAVTNASQPVTFEVVVDDTLGGTMVVPANTNLSIFGEKFTQDVTLISATSIVSTNLTIGGVTWTKDDFTAQTLGSTGSTYHILIDGRLDSGSVAKAKFILDKAGAGFVNAGYLSCSPNCSISDGGDTYDYSNDSSGVLTALAATRTTVSQPPQPPQHPSCNNIDTLIAKIEALGLKPAVKELVLAKIKVKARDIRGAKQHVQNFINIVKSLRGNKLKPATADFLILLGHALLHSMR